MRYSALGIGRMLRTLLPMVTITAIMVVAVRFVGCAMEEFSVAARLAGEIAIGVAVYLLLALTFRLEAFGEIRTLIAKMISK